MTNIAEIIAEIILVILSILQQPPLEEMPIYATAYNWNLGGINCNENCGDVAIGLQTSDDLLGKTAACPLVWLGRINTTVVTLPDGNEWYCIDTFGDAHNQRPVFISHPYHGNLWVIRMDFAVTDPSTFEYNQQLIYEWSGEWRPVSELSTVVDVLNEGN